MKTAGWYQRGRSSDFILKLKKKKDTSYYFRLDKLTPNGRLLFENLFPNPVT